MKSDSLSKSVWVMLSAPFIGVILAILVSGCEPPSTTEKSDSFECVSVPNTSGDEPSALNSWLRTNPDKKVVSFALVSSNKYVIYFVSGDNSRQRFERLASHNNNSAFIIALHYVKALQEWKDGNKKYSLVAFCVVEGGGMTVCFEEK